jgi:hypothetical protein
MRLDIEAIEAMYVSEADGDNPGSRLGHTLGLGSIAKRDVPLLIAEVRRLRDWGENARSREMAERGARVDAEEARAEAERITTRLRQAIAQIEIAVTEESWAMVEMALALVDND